jgi:hypothetical protein
MPVLHSKEVCFLSVHDAVIVPESVVDLVIGELEELSEFHLRFVPNFERSCA